MRSIFPRLFIECAASRPSRDWSKLKLSRRDAVELVNLSYNKDYGTSVIDQVMAVYRVRAPVLYRGLTPPEASQASRGFVIPTSMTEDRKEAEFFAREMYKTRVVIELRGASGFPYWQWLLDNSKYVPRDLRRDTLELASKEREWLLPRRTVLDVVGETQVGDLKILRTKRA